jgi:hypothetical protein
MRRATRALLLGVFLLPCTGGCALYWVRQETVRPNERRRDMAFESETAAQLFAEGYEKCRRSTNSDGQFFAIPFVCCLANGSRLSANAIYNDELARCDRDRNGLITEAEARAYNRWVLGTTAEATPSDTELQQAGSITNSIQSIPAVEVPNGTLAPAVVAPPTP